MKKSLLFLLISTVLAGSAVGQALPGKKKKPAAGKTEAAPVEAPSATNPALPKDFDPGISNGMTESKPKVAAEGTPALDPTAKVDKNAKNLKPSNDAYEIGKTQFEKGDEKEALVYLDKSIKLYPNNFPALLMRAKAKVARKLYPEAVVDLNRYIKNIADNAEAYFWRGRAKQEQDKDKEAILDFTKAVSFKADMGDAYYWRGHAYSDLDQLKESACPDFNKAAELGSELGVKAQKKYCTKK